MSRKRSTLVLVVGLGLGVLLLPLGQVASQSIQQVLVTNFPQSQEVSGTVQIDTPVPQSELVTFAGVTVPPVKPTDTTRLVEAGTLVTDGFPSVVLSLHGQVKGSVQKEGAVGAILIPDQRAIIEAFDEQGLVHFSLSATATPVSSRTPHFASDQPKFTVAFQAYKVFLYNTTDKTVSVDLFAYLTN